MSKSRRKGKTAERVFMSRKKLKGGKRAQVKKGLRLILMGDKVDEVEDVDL